MFIEERKTMIFESERLTFRLLEQEDMDGLFHIWGDRETMRFCGGVVIKEKIPQIIEHNRRQYNTYGNAVFAVTKNDRLLGICGGKLDEDDPFHVEIILHLEKEYWHQGYGTEALKAYLAWLKAGKRATHVYASVHPDNQASINMVKKCGLVPCGFRQYEDTGFVDEPYFELDLEDI